GDGSGVDSQTIEVFKELSEQMGRTKRDLAEVEAQLQTCLREQKRAVLTRGELEGVGDGARMFQTVGKMFMLRSKDEIKALLQSQKSNNSSS
ncbi:unnamed protein product, partial [Discosporangium mesarthrocarpum]